MIAGNLAFVVAHGAGLEAVESTGPDAYDPGVASERAWQTAWIVGGLVLPT